MSEQEITAIVEQNDSQAFIAYFHGMPESRRRSLAPLCLKLLKRVKKGGEKTVAAEAAVTPAWPCFDSRRKVARRR